MIQNYSKIETLKNCVTTDNSRIKCKKILRGGRRVSPEPEINITHNTCFMPPGSICHSL